MKTIEYSVSQQQTNVEQSALFPSITETHLTTDDVIIRGEDSLAHPQTEQHEKSYEEQLEASVVSAKAEYRAVLEFKVKNELIAQVFGKGAPENGVTLTDGAVNIAQVAAVLQSEIDYELNRNFQGALFIENEAIPDASTRTEPIFGQPGRYSVQDIEKLQIRADSYQAMADYIAETMPRDELALYDEAERYIAALRSEAQAEALTILKQQKELLENRKREADQKIAELEGAISSLSHELADSKEQIQDRDMLLLDHQIEADTYEEEVKRLTKAAQALAA